MAAQPWHKVVELRPDLRSGELAMNMFAADLHEAFMQNGRHPIYENPDEFFALTFPTISLRKLAKDVCQRLAGKNDKAVRQLQLTYGGGKTHALITLLHLARNPASLPDLPAVDEFKGAVEEELPKARVAALCFDKIDPEAPIDVKSPTGEIKSLKQPWSILAWQIAGQEGLAAINPENPDAERETPPFQEVLGKLLSIPTKDGLALLILIDEVLMYAHTKVSQDSAWRNHLINFFQCLTQAASQTKNCCLVASLLASDTAKEDIMGKSLQSELYEIFNRQREEAVEPVGKEDVAEVLRRRFFVPDSIRDPKKFRPHAQAAMKGVLDLADNKLSSADEKRLEDKFYKSFPFHPDLTDIFFSKWTQMRGYQKTRGALRTFALALREAEQWDQSPIISASVFLNEPDTAGISPAARELVIVADNADESGPQAVWTGILEKELEIAKDIQSTLQLKLREIEQAVMGTFLHSQPLGQDAKLRDLLNLIGPVQPDKINLNKGLQEWSDLSFWLDDEFKPKEGELPSAWRLGRKPNLTQMHSQAKAAINSQVVEGHLINSLHKDKLFKSGNTDMELKTHILPANPAEVQDDGKFHYVVLSVDCASEPRKISQNAIRYLEEGASENSPRAYRNSLIMLAPSPDGLDMAKNRIRDALAWEQVLADLRQQGKGAIDPARESTLASNKKMADGKAQEAIRQAWTMAVVMSEKGAPQCFKINLEAGISHFDAIKNEQKIRIKDSISSEAILPGGPYNLWQNGDQFKRVQTIYQSFAKFPHLPKLIRQQLILDTIKTGCTTGLFVLKLSRPDCSSRTWWMNEIDDTALKDSELELWLPEYAQLEEIDVRLLIKGILPGLWPNTDDSFLTIQSVKEYFDGQHRFKTQMGDYEVEILVPKAADIAVENALKKSVESGKLWLFNSPSSLLGEAVEPYQYNDLAQFYMPPEEIPPMDILPGALSTCWKNDATTVGAIDTALAQKNNGRALPWKIVQNTINKALQIGLVKLDSDSVWPTTRGNADNVTIKLGSAQTQAGAGSSAVEEDKKGYPNQNSNNNVIHATLTLNELQALGELVPDFAKLLAGSDLDIKVGINIVFDNPNNSDLSQIVAKVKNIIQDSEDISVTFSDNK